MTLLCSRSQLLIHIGVALSFVWGEGNEVIFAFLEVKFSTVTFLPFLPPK